MPARIFHKSLAALKPIVGPILSNRITGGIIAAVLGNRIPHRGLIVDTSSPVVSNDIKAALFFRGYESGEYRFVRKYLPKDCDVVELGGSLGVISCTIRRHINPDRKLVIVEADPRLAAALERNLAINGCAENTVVENRAISYSGQQMVSFSLGETSVSGRLAEHAPGLTQVSVRSARLSDLLAEHNLSDFCLVSDIEGVEWQIVREDMASLARARFIVMETHDVDNEGTFTTLIARIEASGFFALRDLHGPVAVFERLAGVSVPGQ